MLSDYCGVAITCGRRMFQKLAPETGKVRLPTVQRLNSSTASWLKEADCSSCQEGTSATRVKYLFLFKHRVQYKVKNCDGSGSLKNQPCPTTFVAIVFPFRVISAMLTPGRIITGLSRLAVSALLETEDWPAYAQTILI